MHLDVRIEEIHPSVVVQTLSAEASAKTAASRHRSGEYLSVRLSFRVAACSNCHALPNSG